MSTGHKAALARGRAESATVRHYLEALETSKPKRGRKRTPASIDKRLGTIESQLAGADALTRLHLLQEQKDLLDERSRVDQVKDLTALEKQFVKVAKAYGERKGITYSTWRAAGVSAAVLQKAEVSRAQLTAAASSRPNLPVSRAPSCDRDGGASPPLSSDPCPESVRNTAPPPGRARPRSAAGLARSLRCWLRRDR